MRNNVIFGGVDFAENGVWVTGSGTFSAPQRDVTVVSVPGRNGDLVIDNGKWNNITDTYPCFIRDNFDQNMASFRSLLCSKLGYQKLEDSYHPDEYRLGAFSEGLFPTMRQRNKGGEFDVTFNCKPQRFLKSGDEPLQFLMVAPIGSDEIRSHFIPVAGDLDFVVHCKSDDELTVTLETVDDNADDVDSEQYTCVDGSTEHYEFTASDKYWRLIIEDITDIDAVWLEIKTTTEYEGQLIPVDAIMTRTWKMLNPTGFESKPMIEVYGCRIPNINITNYVNGVSDEYYSFDSDVAVDVLHMWMDCDMQYVYDDDKTNLTKLLRITTAESSVGESLVFPCLGTNEIELFMYSSSAFFDTGMGLVQIYPRWWKL